MRKILIFLVILAMMSTCTALNRPPSIPSLPSGPTVGISGTSYSYSTSSIDPNGDKVKYVFYWGDRTTTTTGLFPSGQVVTVSHKWPVTGTTKTYNVYVKAIDSFGSVSTFSQKGTLVTISDQAATNQAPYAPYTPWGTTAAKSGNTYSYSVYAIDPDGDRVKYTFDWGDGTTTTTALVASGTESSASHRWTVSPNTQKTFNVRATATDEHGATSGWSVARVVNVLGPRINYPPTTASTPVGPTSGIAGVTYSYTTSATDPDGDTIQYIFCWGDATETTGFYPSGAVVTASHSWNNAGFFDVRVIAVDSLGQCSEEIWEAPLRVTITNPPALKTMAEVDESVFAVEPTINETDPIEEPIILNKTIEMGDNSSPNELAGNSS
jgi:hypothetical protein